jgi:hypothetical protein
MNLLDPPVEFDSRDRLSPQAPVPISSGRYQPEPETCARPDRSRADTLDCRRIDFGFVAIAVDHCPRDMLNDRSKTGSNRAPAKPIHQRILERFQRGPAARGIGQNVRVVLPSGMGHGQQYRQGSARRMNRRARVAAHVQQAPT